MSGDAAMRTYQAILSSILIHERQNDFTNHGVVVVDRGDTQRKFKLFAAPEEPFLIGYAGNLSMGHK